MYKKGIKYKCRKHLQTYKQKELKSTFIEVNRNNKKLMVGCIYRHPSMDLSELDNHFLPIQGIKSDQNPFCTILQIIQISFSPITP